MKEFKRVLTLKMLLFLVILALVSFAGVRLSFHYSEGFKDSYNNLINELSELPIEEQNNRIDDFNNDALCRSLAYLYYSADSDDLRDAYSQMAYENIGDDWQDLFASMDLSDTAMEEFYSVQQAYSLIAEQVDHIAGYQDYLSYVHENAQQMSNLPIYNKDGENSFSMRNFKRTDLDFPQSGEIDISLTNTLPVEGFVNDKVCGVCLLLWMLAIVLKFMQERHSSLQMLVYTTPGGRSKLAAKRILILLFAAVLGTIIICGASLASLIQLYGPIDLSAAVQSSALFKTFTFRMDYGQFLLIFFVLKAIGMWVVSLLIYLIILAIDHLNTALVAAGFFLIIEFSLFAYIPDSYSLAILRYINLFAFVDPGKVFLNYLNLNIFGFPVRGAFLSIAIIPVVAALCILLIAIHSEKSHPAGKANIFVRVSDMIRVFFSKRSFHAGLFVCEFKKILWHLRGWIAIALLVIWCFAIMPRPPIDTEMFDTDIAVLQAKYQGEVTDDTMYAVRTEIAEVEAMEDSAYKFEKLEILEEFQDEVSEKAENGYWIVNPAPISALTTRDRQYQRTSAAVQLLIVVLLCAGIFAYENQNSTAKLIHSMPLGRGYLIRRKLSCAVIFAAFVWLLISARELYLCASFFETEIPLSAPVRSIAFFEKLPDISIGVFLVAFYLIRLLALGLAAFVCCLISKLCKTVNISLVVCFVILVLPVLLSLFGIDIMDMASLSRLLSPCELL